MNQHFKFLFATVFGLYFGLNASTVLAQKNNPVVFSYGEQSVRYDEFKRGLLKNQSPEASQLTEQDIEDYLNLYMHFRLKVQDAYDQKLDTSRYFKGELNVYRKQIARPFLTDKNVSEKLMKEAYERHQYDINAAHILIEVKNFENPSDTLEAYNKIDSIRNLIVNNTMSFAEAASLFSQDPSARVNKGELGYFTVFQMVYPFESMAYNTPQNEISPVFKTDFGYHILQVLDKRPNPGSIQVAHIMLLNNTNATEAEKARNREKAQEIYNKIMSGEKTFEEMARLYSEDNSSKNFGGVLEAFSRTSQFPAQFKDAAFLLEEDGAISKPVITDYGIHIIKRISLTPVSSYEQMKNKLSQDINRDSRSYKNTLAVFDRVSQELNLKHNAKSYKRFMKKYMNNTYLENNWTYAPKKDSAQILFSFADVSVPVRDFARHLIEQQSLASDANLEALIQKHYNKFVVDRVMEHYEKNLDQYNAEYRHLLRDYKDGILLFSLMDDKIWSQSMRDSVGLETFFKERQSQYQWDERVQMHIFATSDTKVVQTLKDMLNKKISNDSIVNYFKTQNPLALNVRKGLFSLGDDDFVDEAFSQPRKTAPFYYISEEDPIYYIHSVEAFFEPTAKTLDEIRGPVISEYQDYLEEIWIQELKEKYPVQINQEALTMLIQELTQ